MVSRDENERLVNGRNGSVLALGVVVKCAACLLVLAAIAVTGYLVDVRPEPATEAIAGASPALDPSRVLALKSFVTPASDAAPLQARTGVPQSTRAN